MQKWERRTAQMSIAVGAGVRAQVQKSSGTPPVELTIQRELWLFVSMVHVTTNIGWFTTVIFMVSVSSTLSN